MENCNSTYVMTTKELKACVNALTQPLLYGNSDNLERVKNRLNAEAAKNKAETKRIKAETKRIIAQWNKDMDTVD